MLEIEFDEQNLDRMISVNSKSKENLAPDTVSFYLSLTAPSKLNRHTKVSYSPPKHTCTAV